MAAWPMLPTPKGAFAAAGASKFPASAGYDSVPPSGSLELVAFTDL